MSEKLECRRVAEVHDDLMTLSLETDDGLEDNERATVAM